MGSIAEKQETLDDWDAHSMGPLRRVKAADHGRARRGGEGEGKSGPGRSPRAAHRRPRRLPANERAALQRVLCDRVWGAERSGMKDAFQSHNNNETKLSTGKTDERERERARQRPRPRQPSHGTFTRSGSPSTARQSRRAPSPSTTFRHRRHHRRPAVPHPARAPFSTSRPSRRGGSVSRPP